MVRHCIRRQCFILLPNVWVVFKIYFAIPNKIVAINNVQQCIRLNKQKGERKKSFCAFALLSIGHVTHPGHLRFCTTFDRPCYTSGSFALLHYFRSAMLHIRVICAFALLSIGHVTHPGHLRFCTTFDRPCYTSGSFAFSTWQHGRDVLIRVRCVVTFLKTVTFNFI